MRNRAAWNLLDLEVELSRAGKGPNLAMHRETREDPSARVAKVDSSG